MAQSLPPYELKSARLLWPWDICAQLSSCQKKTQKTKNPILLGVNAGLLHRLSNSDLPKYWPVVRESWNDCGRVRGRTSGTTCSLFLSALGLKSLESPYPAAFVEETPWHAGLLTVFSEKWDSTRSHPCGDSMLEHEASSDGQHVDLSGVPGDRGVSHAHPMSHMECSWLSLCSGHCQRQRCLWANRFPLKQMGEGPPECPCSPLPPFTGYDGAWGWVGAQAGEIYKSKGVKVHCSKSLVMQWCGPMDSVSRFFLWMHCPEVQSNACWVGEMKASPGCTWEAASWLFPASLSPALSVAPGIALACD